MGGEISRPVEPDGLALQTRRVHARFSDTLKAMRVQGAKEVDIRVACHGLPVQDSGGQTPHQNKADPMVVICERDRTGDGPPVDYELGRTEALSNSPDPVFAQHIRALVLPGAEAPAAPLVLKVYELNCRTRAVLRVDTKNKKHCSCVFECEFILQQVDVSGETKVHVLAAEHPDMPGHFLLSSHEGGRSGRLDQSQQSTESKKLQACRIHVEIRNPSACNHTKAGTETGSVDDQTSRHPRGLKLTMHARNLPFKKRVWGEDMVPMPYVEIHRRLEDSAEEATWPVLRTWMASCVKHSQDRTLRSDDPTLHCAEWDDVVLPLEQVCRGNMDAEVLQLQAWDFNKLRPETLIGQFPRAPTRSMAMIKKQADQNSGRAPTAWMRLAPQGAPAPPDGPNLSVSNARLVPVVEVKSLLEAGLKLRFSFALDFSSPVSTAVASAGRIHDPNDPEFQIRRALEAAGQVAEHCTDLRDFHAWAFGLRQGSHGIHPSCQELTANGSPDLDGKDALLRAYDSFLGNHGDAGALGPVPCADCVTRACEEATAAAQSCEGANGLGAYTCLVVLTRGEFSDKQKAWRAILEASHAPLSIICVSLGDRKYNTLEAMDNDGRWKSSGTGKPYRDLLIPGGERLRRDNVQVFKFNDVRAMPGLVRYNHKMFEYLMLEELPDHLVEFFELRELQHQ